MHTDSVHDIVNRVEELYNAQDMLGAKTLAMNHRDNLELLSDLQLYSRFLEFVANASYLLSDFVDAVYFYQEGIRVNTVIGNKTRLSAAFGNIGLTKFRMADYSGALEYLERAITINEEIGNNKFLAYNLGNVGNVFSNLSEYDKALEYHNRALAINMEINDLKGIGGNLGNIGNLCKQQSKYEDALTHYQKSLDIHLQIRDKEGVALSYENIGVVFIELNEYDKSLEYLDMAIGVYEEIHNKQGIANVHGSIARVHFVIGNHERALYYIKESIALASEIELRDSLMHSLRLISEIYESINDYKMSLKYHKEYIAIRDIIRSDETKKRVLLFDQQKKLESEEKVRQLQIARMEEQEKLLYNILPNNIAERILKHESSIADYYPSVSVLFMDIVGFTELSSYLSPKQLVFLLDLIFTKADEILDDFGLEKIKTIGDGYLAVANLTKQIDNHEFVAASAAIQLLDSLSKMKYEIPADKDDLNQNVLSIQLRIGLHSGEVVAGIVGKNKFIFDLWGDVVNIASRMESGSEPGKIQISEVMAKQIEGNSSIRLVPRGSIEIKGKGMMQTYWLESNIITS